MKKIIVSLFVLTLAGSLYAGDACCSAKESTEKVEKKICADCGKVEGSCDACKAKAKAKAAKEIVVEEKVVEKKD